MHTNEDTTELSRKGGKASESCGPPCRDDDERVSGRIDLAGIGLSIGCLLHCLLGPIIISAFPWIDHEQWDYWVHPDIFMLIAPVGIYSLTRSRHRHAKWEPLVLGMIGLGFLLLGVFEPTRIGHLIPNHQALFTVVNFLGGTFLITAHLKNIWALKSSSPKE